MSYTEVTSLDGSPSLWQKVRVAYFRFVKPIIVDGIVQQRIIVKGILKTLWWIVTVGLSGCLVTAYYDWKNDDKKELHNRIERSSSAIIQSESQIGLDVKEISRQVDSLNSNVLELLNQYEQNQ